MNSFVTAPEPDYEIVRSARRRTISIEVLRDQKVRVRAPEHTPMQSIRHLLRSKRSWIIEKQALQAARPQPLPLSWDPGSEHDYLGQSLRLVYSSLDQIRQAGDVYADLEKGELHVLLQAAHPPSLLTTRLEIRNRLYGWYLREAQRVFSQRLEHWRQAIPDWPRQPRQLTIRDMRRNWGSCSSKGRITLNLKAIRLPLELIDYIICHELCHLREMNHSRAFYDLQRALMPDYEARRHQLRQLEERTLREA